MENKLPVYKLKIKEDDNVKTSVEFIALVDDPAIQIDWQMFNRKIKFAADTERRLLMGPLMIANMPIYRRDDKMGEYYVIFDKEEIYKIVQKFFRNGFTSNFNLMHDKEVSGIYLIESFIIDDTRGVKAPEAFKDLSQGSWLGTVKVDNDEIWNDFIKTGTLKGFSVEGIFGYERIDDAEETVLSEIADIVRGQK